MKVPFVDLSATHSEIAEELRSAIDRVFASSAFTGGPAVDEFETKFAKYCGTKYCVAVGSGTAALEILLRAYEIGPGDEVVLPANTFVATIEAISLVGAKPVLVDVRDNTANLDPELLAAAVGDKTRAIIPVHLYGQTVEMEPIIELARRQGIVVIEDACQAHGAMIVGKRVGSIADAAAFSFYPVKNLGACGEAGGITTDDTQVAKRARMLRDHGSNRKYYHQIVGRNDRIDGIQASILNVKLDHLDRWNKQRRRIADAYSNGLKDKSRVRLLAVAGGCDHVYHLYVVQVANRDRLRTRLLEHEIATGIHYPVPLHLQAAYAGLGYQKGEFPVSERLAKEIVSLPMYPQLQPNQVDFVLSKLIEFVE
jgi:dTDP-4-amino-4,6-dideoxygalactose transaminase